MKPTTEQLNIIETAKTGVNLAISAFAGAAKCLGKGTLITMADGRLKAVEEIVKGDKVLGVNGEPRPVLEVSSGKEEMFKIKQVKGIDFVCNKSHILSVKMAIGKNTRYKYKDTFLYKGDIVNLSVEDYLTQSPSFQKDAKCYTPNLMDFKNPVPVFEPYFIGLWLGDGNTSSCCISKPDPEIKNYLESFAKKHSLAFTTYIYDGKCPVYALGRSSSKGTENAGNSILRSLNILDNKHIPFSYKFSSIEDRLALVAGLLDSDGSLIKNYFTWSSKNLTLTKDMEFVCRTLGFKVTREIFKVKGYDNDYYRLSIFGEGLEKIPTKIRRKQAAPRQQIKNANVTGFIVEPLGSGDYYGFTIDGDSLFLLEDFTVTHNTTTCRMVAEEITRPSLYIAFNKAIADEAKTKFPAHVDCRTLHSIAYETIVIGNKNYQKRLKGSLDSREIVKFLDTDLVGKDYKTRLKIVRKVRKVITEFCQSAERDISAIAERVFKAEIVNELRLKIGYDNISWEFVEEQVEELAPLVTKVWDALVDRNGTMTLSHDIYLKLYHLGNPTIHNKFKTIYLDEAQDSNDLTLDIVFRCADRGAQVILVGDTYQSIYAWRGAVNAFDKIPDSFTRLSLTTSFRFHSGIAAHANKILGWMGSKETLIGAGKIDNSNYDPSDRAILCRTNSGVFAEVMNFADKAEQVYCTSDFSEFFSAMWHMIALHNKTTPKYPHKDFESLVTWEDWERELDNGELDLVGQCNFWLRKYKYDTKALANTMMKVKNSIAKVKSEGMVTITTIHKSKGQEFWSVKISDDMYRQLTEESYEDSILRLRNKFKETQEGNCLYIAITRSKQELVFSDKIRDLIYGLDYA